MNYRNHFKIIVPLYNVEKWIKLCLNSVLLQEYENYECIIINDKSTDNTLKIIKDLNLPKDKFKVITNSQNLGPLANAYYGVVKHSTDLSDQDIIVILDGDDFFASDKTLTILNEEYNKNDCWMTYGSYINLSDRQRGKFSYQIPEAVIKENSYRSAPWCTSHLRSYKAFLVKMLDKKDLCDSDGKFYRAAGDLAMMFPLLEMCGHRSHFVEKILYVWNDQNVLNEHKTKRDQQVNCETVIRNNKRYKPLTGATK